MAVCSRSPTTATCPTGGCSPSTELAHDAGVVDQEYVERRARWEPLYEATQIKGDGETHPLLSPDDEFADYETWDQGNLDLTEFKTDDMLPREYARSGLQLGMQLEKRFGTNPYKFGMIGSTDSHTGLATAAEDNFFGKHSGTEPSAGALGAPDGQDRRRRIPGLEHGGVGATPGCGRRRTRARRSSTP